MPYFRTVVILALSSLVAAGNASAANISAANVSAVGAGAKGQKPPVVAQPSKPPAGRNLEDAPIVMGRSVSVQRKSKLHHIKVKSIQPAGASKN